VGQKVKVRYVETDTYTLDLEVTTISSPEEFVGRVEAIFLPTLGEITGGPTFDKLMGHEKLFRNEDILLRQVR
jgi:hypothetical protein